MKIEFAFKEEESGIFGKIARPVARLFITGDNQLEIPKIFYVDSGADVTLIPLSLGELLGFSLRGSTKILEIKGIGERGIPFVLKRIKIRLNEKIIFARIAWSLIEEVPALLGRLDIFRLFNINFQKEKVTSFED